MNVCSVVLSFFVNEALRHESFVMCTVTTSKCSQGAASDTKRLREGLRQRAKRDSKFDPKNKSSRDAHSATTQRDKSLSYRLYPYGHHTWPLGAPALGYQLSPHRRVLLSLPTTGVCHFRNRASISRSSTCSSLISHLSSLNQSSRTIATCPISLRVPSLLFCSSASIYPRTRSLSSWRFNVVFALC